MANEITIINGVSKQEKGGNLIYHFDLCQIIAFTDATPSNEYYIQSMNNGQQLQRVNWGDITDKLGASDMEGYLDAVATAGYFASTIPADTENEEDAEE